MAASDNLSLEEQRRAEQALYQSDVMHERTDSWLSRQFKEERTDTISRPSHYNIGGIEPAEFMESLGIAQDYYAGNIIKYASRYKHKNGAEDIRKAKQYCKMLIELLESEV
jgi:hypothetical protein